MQRRQLNFLLEKSKGCKVDICDLSFSGAGLPVPNTSEISALRFRNEGGSLSEGLRLFRGASRGQDPFQGDERWRFVVTLQVIPKVAVDKIPVFLMAYGLSASADGNLFPWIFNAGNLLGWTHQPLSATQPGGIFDKLKGKKIGLVHLDAPYGKEPIPYSGAHTRLRLRA